MLKKLNYKTIVSTSVIIIGIVIFPVLLSVILNLGRLVGTIAREVAICYL